MLLYQEFMKGKFTINKSGRSVSAMGEDQAHKQHNKVIKEDGGCVGLFANTPAILEWAISSPFIIEIVNNETVMDNDAYEKMFRSEL